jgi:hypothetical protein
MESSAPCNSLIGNPSLKGAAAHSLDPNLFWQKPILTLYNRLLDSQLCFEKFSEKEYMYIEGETEAVTIFVTVTMYRYNFFYQSNVTK